MRIHLRSVRVLLAVVAAVTACAISGCEVSTPPVDYAQPSGVFVPASLKIAEGKLYTGVDYADSVYTVFQRNWNAHGFNGI